MLLTGALAAGGGLVAYNVMLPQRAQKSLDLCSLPWDDRRLGSIAPEDACVVHRNFSMTGANPNICMIVNDAWRHDHFSATVTPRLWDYSRSCGIVFHHHFANAGHTRPSAASYFSGRIPRFLKGTKTGDTGFSALNPIGFPPGNIPPGLPTFPEMLKNSKKYITVSVVQNPMLSQVGRYGAQHWDFHLLDYPYEIVEIDRDRNGTIDENTEKFIGRDHGGGDFADLSLHILRRIRKANPGVPLFLYLHFMDSHSPYNRRRDPIELTTLDKQYFSTIDSGDMALREKLLPVMKERYVQGTRNFDLAVVPLLKSLFALDDARNTVAIVTSDHGEMFNEHREPWNIGHGEYLPAEAIHIPCVLFAKRGIEPRQEWGLTQNVDLAPTILNLAGVELGCEMKGKDLTGAVETKEARASSIYETAIVNIRGGRPSIHRTPIA